LASHVLSTGISKLSDTRRSNLLAALECAAESELIESTIYAYRDRSAQPYCDLLLAQFAPNEILSLYLKTEWPDSNMKVGVLEDMDREPAKQLGRLKRSDGRSG
jgi:hypothetical protein